MLDIINIVNSASILAEISGKSSRKLFIFIPETYIIWINVSNKHFI